MLPGSLALSLNASSQSSPTLRLDGAVLPATSTLAVNGLGTSATVQVTGAVVNQGSITGTSTGYGSSLLIINDASGGGATSLVNTGAISFVNGTAQILLFGSNRADAVINDGLLAFSSTNGTAYGSQVTAPILGTGTLSISRGETLDLVGQVGAGQTVRFDPAGSGATYLQLANPSSFAATLSGFVASDSLVLGQLSAPTLSYASTSATSGTITVQDGGSVVGSFKLSGVHSASDLSLSTATLGDGSTTTILTTTATAPSFSYTDTTTSASGAAAPDLYSGPVNYLQWQYLWPSDDGAAISASRDNAFLHGGAGADALAVQGGSNVLDGGGSSNFLVGASGSDGGTDTFFVDGRGGTVTWSSIVNFHQGDSATIFGFTQGTSTLPLTANDGAAGYTGATIHSELNGAGTGVNGSVTFAGISAADAQDVSQGGKFTYSYGSTGGASYLNITYTGWQP